MRTDLYPRDAPGVCLTVDDRGLMIDVRDICLIDTADVNTLRGLAEALNEHLNRRAD